MAGDRKVSALNPAGLLSGSEEIYVVQDGEPVRLDLATLAAYIKTAETIVPANLPYRGCRVKRTTEVTGLTWPSIVSWQAEDFDTDGIWGIADPTKFVIPAGVTKVRLIASVELTANGNPGSNFVTIRKNSTGTGGGAVPIPYTPVSFRQSNTGFSTNVGVCMTGVMDVIEGDYFDCRVNSLMTGVNSIVATVSTFFELEVVEVSGA